MRAGKTQIWLELLDEYLNKYKSVFVVTKSKSPQYYINRFRNEFDLDIEVIPHYVDNNLSGYEFSKI